MQFILKVFRNSADVILLSAFFGLYESLKLKESHRKGGNRTQSQSTSMDKAQLETAFSIADCRRLLSNLFIGLSFLNHINLLHTRSLLYCRLSDGNV